MSTGKLVFHLLPNAHLDPVWLWDWREGLTEGITTVRTVLDLMDERPELTFMRGEAVIYRHIQQYAPDLFRRIRQKIDAGRWDVVGGTWVQPDSNLPSTETLCRNFEMSLAYFERELGVRPTAAWQADSFGHSAGWPNILRSFGMDGFAFTRPQRAQFPMESPVFWWDCDHDDRLLCYRQHGMWYCTERGTVPALLDETLAASTKQPWRNVGVLIGLGNHGGGPTRRHLDDVAKWSAAHPDVEVRYSTLHGLFAALQHELGKSPAVVAPSVKGEFGYCLRGCYSSVQKFKSLYRQTEQALVAAEAVQSLVGAHQPGAKQPLDEAWESVLFNSFHDILPGSSIERAIDDQLAWTSVAMHHAQKASLNALTRLAAAVDTRVPPPASPDAPTQVPVLVWNPSARPFSGGVEIETSLDYRPFFQYKNRTSEFPFALWDAKGRPLPFQEIATEHSSMPSFPWRKRVVVQLRIPSFGWHVVRMGLAAQKMAPVKGKNPCHAGTGAKPWISSDRWRVGVDASGGIAIKLAGKNLFCGRERLRLLVVEDSWGSWGGMEEEPSSWQHDRVREEWKLVRSEVVEAGSERSRLWTRWSGKNSWVELTFEVGRDMSWVAVHGRLLWSERSARLQLVLPSKGPAVCDVPGGVATRSQRGQVPVGRWFHRVNSLGTCVGVASDVLGDADFLSTETRLTLARATRYANDVATGPADKPWLPAVDCGELKFRLRLFTDGMAPDDVAETLIAPPVMLPVLPSPGSLPSTGSLGELKPDGMRLLSIHPAADGTLRVRVQNRGEKTVVAKFMQAGKTVSLGRITPQQIVTKTISS